MAKTKPLLNKPDIIGKWIDEGFQVYYARFHQPVPPSVNAEPVSEFSISNKHQKYVVDEMHYTPHGLIWFYKGEIDIQPLANVVYARSNG